MCYGRWSKSDCILLQTDIVRMYLMKLQRVSDKSVIILCRQITALVPNKYSVRDSVRFINLNV